MTKSFFWRLGYYASAPMPKYADNIKDGDGLTQKVWPRVRGRLGGCVCKAAGQNTTARRMTAADPDGELTALHRLATATALDRSRL